MAEGVDEAVVVEDVVCADEEAQLLLKRGWDRHYG